jgi:hypothetical protein
MECGYRQVFGLIIGFIGPFDTARDYTIHITVTQTSVLSLLQSPLVVAS